MKIRDIVSRKEMTNEVDKYNNSGLVPLSTPARLKKYMFVEDDEVKDRFRYSVYEEDGDRYRLLNRLPYDFFERNCEGVEMQDELKIELENMQALI